MKIIITESQLNSLITEEKGRSKLDYPECVRNLGDIGQSPSGQLFILASSSGDYKNWQFYYNGRVKNSKGDMQNYSCLDGELIIGKTEEFVEACKRNTKKAIPKAYNFWSQWINSPIIKGKFMKNSNLSELKYNEIISKYKKWLNKLHIIHEYRPNSKEAYYRTGEAEKYIGRIHYNCYFEDGVDEIYKKLVHEISHALDDIFPLNPKEMINKFIRKDEIPSWDIRKLTSIEKTDIADPQIGFKLKQDEKFNKSLLKKFGGEQVKKVSEAFDISMRDALYYMNWWRQRCLEHVATDGPAYDLKVTEKQSNLEGLRSLFFTNPKTGMVDFSKNITASDLKPYFLRDKSDADAYWLLRAWARSGFRDLNAFLQDMNSLARNKIDNKVTPSQSSSSFGSTG